MRRNYNDGISTLLSIQTSFGFKVESGSSFDKNNPQSFRESK